MKSIVRQLALGIALAFGGIVVIITCIFNAIYCMLRTIRYAAVRACGWIFRVNSMNICEREKWNYLMRKITTDEIRESMKYADLRVE